MQKEYIDKQINDMIDDKNSMFQDSEINAKNIIHCIVVVGSILSSLTVMPVLARFLPSIVAPAIGLAAINVSAITSIINNLMQDNLEVKKQSLVNKHLQGIKKTGLQNSEELTIKRMDKKNELFDEYIKAEKSKDNIKALSYLGLSLEVIGEIMSIINQPVAIALILSGLGINLAEKKADYSKGLECQELDRRITNLNNDIYLSPLFIKYKKAKTNLKVQTDEHEHEKEKDYTEEQQRQVENYVEGLAKDQTTEEINRQYGLKK